MDPLLRAIAEGWSWKLGEPVELVATNLFGNAIVKDRAGRYFRIMPEEWLCELMAHSADELDARRQDEEFVRDWEMKRVVALAADAQGPLAEGQVYFLVVPGILGGQYSGENIRKISLRELLAYAGSMARQMEDVPDGSQVKIVVKE